MKEKSIVINYCNLLLGIILLFLILTNVELNSTIANFIFPLFVLLFGFLSYKKITTKQKGKLLFYLPSFIGGFGFYIVIILFFLINFLGSLFWINEEINKERIQRCYSPNKIEYCDAYHYPVGAYSGGSGHVCVFLVNKFFPIVRKEVFYEPTAHVWIEGKEDIPYEYFVWEDKDSIKIYKSNIVNVRGIIFYPVAMIKSFADRETEYVSQQEF